MLARARREVDEMRSAEEQTRLAEEARRLIEEADKERAKAEALLADQTRASHAQPGGRGARNWPSAARRPGAGREAQARAPDPRRAPGRTGARGQEERAGSPRRRRWAPDRRPPPQVATSQRPTPAPERTERARDARRHPSHALRRPRLPPPAARRRREPRRCCPTSAPPPPSGPAAPASHRSGRPAGRRTAARRPPRASSPWSPPQAPVAARVATHVTVLLIMEPGTSASAAAAPRSPIRAVQCARGATSAPAPISRPSSCRTQGARLRQHLGGRGLAPAATRSDVSSAASSWRAARLLQPVDLHIIKHDRRARTRSLPNSDCRTEAGRLSCTPRHLRRGLHHVDRPREPRRRRRTGRARARDRRRPQRPPLRRARAAAIARRPGLNPWPSWRGW